MALLVTLFLVLVNIFNTVTTNTPKAEGLTAIEAWMLACILFVFGALTEYAGILFRYDTYCTVRLELNANLSRAIKSLEVYRMERTLLSRQIEHGNKCLSKLLSPH